MAKNHGKDLKISFPKWFFIPFGLGGIIILLTFIFYTARLIQSESSTFELLKVAFLFVVLLGWIFFFCKILFYSVTATERGLETDNLAGSKKIFLWDEIVEVRRPRFGIPKDANYVISKNRDKLLLVKSMTNYKELVQMIKVRAPNLKRYPSGDRVKQPGRP